jgi:hypothetical protein
MGRVWNGQHPLTAAIERGEIRLHGRVDLERSLPKWLMLSVIAQEAARQRGMADAH